MEVLGPASAPGVDLLSVVRSYHLPTEFPRNVLTEADKIPQTVQSDMLLDREDLRNQFIVTIDPDDARDFDDAINVEKLDGGGYSYFLLEKDGKVVRRFEGVTDAGTLESVMKPLVD